jgi:hypothetical protein
MTAAAGIQTQHSASQQWMYKKTTTTNSIRSLKNQTTTNLQTLLDDLLGLLAADGHVHCNLLVAADAEAAHGVAS